MRAPPRGEAALDLDGGRYASPYNFVRALRSRRVLAPPAQRHDAVRLLQEAINAA